ncbi:MAG: hypothetical protein WAN75_16015, partial [Xanthobacteraceae bacterium]
NRRPASLRLLPISLDQGLPVGAGPHEPLPGEARNEKTDPVTLVDTITYYDGGLTGTICPPGAALLSIPFLAPSPARDCRA